MKFIDLKGKLRPFALFNLGDIRKIEADFDLRRLNEWTAKGYIKKIRRGYYIFSDLNLDEGTLFLIANGIYRPSYISLEMALSVYGLIPESVYGITSATSKKTNRFRTNAGDFIYRHVKPELLFGCELRECGNRRCLVAEMEKAVLDYLYLNPRLKSGEDFQGLRFNAAEFRRKADMNKFAKYLEAFGCGALSKRAGKFLQHVTNA